MNENIKFFYQILINSAEKISELRQKANAYFLSIQTFVFTVIILIYKEYEKSSGLFWGLIGLCVITLVINIFWLLTVKSYRDLNKAKFSLINKFEFESIYQLYKDELEILKNKHKYIQLTKIEIFINIFFFIIILTTLTIFIVEGFRSGYI